jgi:hypothetical protein
LLLSCCTQRLIPSIRTVFLQSLYISCYAFGINQYCLNRFPYYKSTVVTPNQVVPLVLYRLSLFRLALYFSPIPLCTGRALQLLLFRKDFASKSANNSVLLIPGTVGTVLSKNYIFGSFLYYTGSPAVPTTVGRSICPNPSSQLLRNFFYSVNPI